jgi:hypothetical protein
MSGTSSVEKVIFGSQIKGLNSKLQSPSFNLYTLYQVHMIPLKSHIMYYKQVYLQNEDDWVIIIGFEMNGIWQQVS